MKSKDIPEKLIFQSTLLREERRKQNASILCFHIFQSTLLREERRVIFGISGRCQNFNPRSYERSDDDNDNLLIIEVKFQSTLLREERPIHVSTVERYKEISIHAPTRGATQALL